MIILLPLFVVLAFFLLRANPQRRRAQAQQALLQNLRPGTRVVTVAGVIGTLLGVEGDRAAIEVAPGVVVEFLLAAIVRTADDAADPAGGETPDADLAPASMGDDDGSVPEADAADRGAGGPGREEP